MEDNESIKSNNLKSKKGLLKSISKFIIGFFIVLIILSISIYILGVISLQSTTNTGIDGIGESLGIAIIIRMFQIIGIVLIPSFIAAICGLRYYSGKSNGKLTACWVWGCISLVSNLFILYIVFKVFGSSFETQTLSGINYVGYSIFYIFVFFIFCLPNIFYLIGCYKEQFNIKIHKKIFVSIACVIILILCIIAFIKIVESTNTEKISVSSVTLPTLSEFENELIDRGFIYDLPEGMSELTTMPSTSIVAEDNKYEYQYDLNFEKNSNESYPLFIYSGYESLIQKSSKTDKYYSKGPEDWWISWDIYFVNGQIYAVIGEESQLGSNWETDLFRTKYGRIISEREKITTYNRKGNYFSYGGGIEHNFTGYVRYLSTKMVDKFNSNCAGIIKVDRLDAKTLDSIAKDLSPRYWLEYKNN